MKILTLSQKGVEENVKNNTNNKSNNILDDTC